MFLNILQCSTSFHMCIPCTWLFYEHLAHTGTECLSCLIQQPGLCMFKEHLKAWPRVVMGINTSSWRRKGDRKRSCGQNWVLPDEEHFRSPMANLPLVSGRICICSLLVTIRWFQKTGIISSALTFCSDQFSAESKALKEHGHHNKLCRTGNKALNQIQFDSSCIMSGSWVFCNL